MKNFFIWLGNFVISIVFVGGIEMNKFIINFF